jgi:hypothetical protein
MRQKARHRWLVALAALAALVRGTAALASDSAVPVKLVVAGSAGLDVGQGARLTATAKLPRGAHLLIQASRQGQTPRKLVECLRSPCAATYKDTLEESVGFQALAIKRVGHKVTVLGRSTIVDVFWSEPAPPRPRATTRARSGTPAPSSVSTSVRMDSA